MEGAKQLPVHSQEFRGHSTQLRGAGTVRYCVPGTPEAAGMVPQLVNARRAKLMSGSIDKTDKLDARGINRLQRSGTLPTV